MGWEAILVLLVVVAMVAMLAMEWAPPDLLTLGCLLILVTGQAVFGTKLLPDVNLAFRGFSSPSLITVGVLFVIVTGLMQTGAMSLLTDRLVGRPRSVLSAQIRLLFPVTFLSAFLNNTPIVAMFMPVVDDICKRSRISPSKLYMPMAFAATFGGACTLIGTSTNLVVKGAMEKAGLPPMGFFDITWIGIPCALGGVVFMLLFSQKLLPDRKPAISLSDDLRQYTVEMLVQIGGPLVNSTIREAGLRNLPGLYLAEIERKGEILAAVAPNERLQANDRLVFVGIIESVVDLRKTRGLVPATDQVFKLNTDASHRCLMEAVVSNRCPIIGSTIRDGHFRSRYNAAVIAVARDGKHIPGKIGDIVLQPGDTLLLEGHPDFAVQQRNSSDFFLVSHVENSTPIRHDKSWIAIGILGGMILLASLLSRDAVDGKPAVDFLLPAALIAAIAMVATRCCTGNQARASIDWSVLIVIGASLGIGEAISVSGAAKYLSQQSIVVCGSNAWLQLLVVYFLTMILTELVTNNAAAVLMFPLALEVSKSLGVSHTPFLIVIMVAASMGFATPFGYQTNLMVYGPGGYKFSDYLRVGIPLDLVMLAITVTLTPFVFPF
ncbi:MAG: SLC13 family permease [Planctomycetes bacterium]|nr:SLC13 family permease [Planctomycetota bacterium]